MFTDFIAECRAHKLQINHSQPDVMGAARIQHALKHEAPRPIAVTA
jgi:carbamoyl-phosphate synthase small subunit